MDDIIGGNVFRRQGENDNLEVAERDKMAQPATLYTSWLGNLTGAKNRRYIELNTSGRQYSY